MSTDTGRARYTLALDYPWVVDPSDRDGNVCPHCSRKVTRVAAIVADPPEIGSGDFYETPPSHTAAFLLIPCLHTVEGIGLCEGPPRHVVWRDERTARA